MDILELLRTETETVWINPDKEPNQPYEKINGYNHFYMKAAQNRFMRFMPYIASAFPETAAKMGVIESTLYGVPDLQARLKEQGICVPGKLYLKDDARLPIAGSVKARGGIHEVLKIAETLAHQAGMLQPTDKYDCIDSEAFRNFYSQYTIQVGSTGNLGISIGRMSARLGFRAIVHMSKDAKEWKKELLRKEGVIVKEYEGDYSQAVARGREESAADPNSFFVDDENSEDLFFGYSSAALRLKVQMARGGIPVNAEHPLFVYLPCGVGGAPGGITFGLKQLFGGCVHCFFVEPVKAPCFLLGMASGKHNEISIQDLGLSGETVADGLAVGRASAFSCNMMQPLLSGCMTITDEKMVAYQKLLYEVENIRLEPSACAGFAGLEAIAGNNPEMQAYLEAHDLLGVMDQSSHVIWGTGGGLMPESEF